MKRSEILHLIDGSNCKTTVKLKSYACLRYVRILGKRASSLRDYASNTSDQHKAECNFTVLLRVKISKSVDVHYAGRKQLHPALPTR